MTRLCRWSLYLAAALVLFAAPLSTPRAQNVRPPNIGVIDIQAVLRASTAVQSLSREIERQREAGLPHATNEKGKIGPLG